MLDTNVIVSALLDTGSVPGQVVELCIDDAFTWLMDRRILQEYRDVLPRPKFGFDAGRVEHIHKLANEIGEWVVARPLPLVLRDPSDLPFLEVAVSGSADVLVTGNVRDFRPSEGDVDITIVTPRQFLDLLAGR